MPGIFKKFSANDIKITPFEAHKQYNTTDLASIGASADFVYWAPYNKFYFKDGNRKYFQLDKLYYRDYIRERAHRLELDDATYTTQERRLYEYANVISLSQRTFGSEVQPGTFILSCSYSSSGEQFNILDDGFGNLYDANRGRDNFPNEDYRILYIGPTQAFKRADLTIDYETGNKYVNNPFPNGYIRTVYDDSYFLNEVEFNNVNFTTNNSLSFYNVKTNSIIGGATSSIIIPHQPQFNFEPEDNFTITFYYDVTDTDNTQSTLSREYFILTKEGTKSVPILPSEGTQHTPLSRSGSAKIGTAPVGNQFPYRIYYKGNTPSINQASIFFERSDGETIQFVSASIFGSTSTGKRFVSCKNDNGVLKIKVDNNDEVTSTQQNSPTLNKTVSNKANITLYNKPQPDGSYTNYIGSGSGAISQLMIWNQALSTAEITNVSESIIGTPNIGNIFYDNGFAVITHPSYKNVLNNYDFNGYTSVISASISSSVLGFARPDAGAFNNDGTKLVLSSVEHDNIVEFTLNTPYDVTTITTSESIDNLNIDYSNIYGLTFNNDGSKFYTIRNNSPQLFSYSLSSSYDLRSAYNQNSSTTTGLGFSIVWNNDGTKLFTTDNNGNINQYITPNPFDIDDLVLDYTYNVGHTGNVHGVRFDSSGYKMFIVHISDTTNSPWSNSTSYVTQYALGRPFELKSLNENNRFNSINSIYNFGPDGLDFPSDILFNNDGTKAYITLRDAGFPGDGETEKIWQFDLPQHVNRFEYKNTHLITENEYQCTMTEDEFEFTRNISARKIPFSDSEDIANFATGSNFKPYVTSVGLYDDSGNLLVVGKLGQPIKASSETDTTFVIRFDT